MSTYVRFELATNDYRRTADGTLAEAYRWSDRTAAILYARDNGLVCLSEQVAAEDESQDALGRTDRWVVRTRK